MNQTLTRVLSLLLLLLFSFAEQQFEVVHDVQEDVQVNFATAEESKKSSYPKTVTIFQNGGNNTEDKVGHPVLLDNQDEDFGQFANFAFALAYPQLVDAPEKETVFSIYNRYGTVVESMDQINDGDLLYVVKGEDFFFWPGVYIGHRVPLIHVDSGTPGKTLELITLSLEPRVFLIPNFVTSDECEAIVKEGEKTIIPSRSIIDGKVASETARNSEQAWLGREHDFVLALDKKVGQTVHVPHHLNHDELLQVLRYLPNQHYYAHTDFFKPEYYVHQNMPADRNRMITLLYYLNTPEEGGETAFFNVKGYPAYNVPWGQFNTSDCSKALRVTPKQGDAVLFYNLLVDDHMNPTAPVGDENSNHAGCDVIKGVKWAANKWIWNRPFPSPLHHRV